jgi:hypothetical protein
MTDTKVFDVRRLIEGNIVEYVNSKGSKRLVLINKRVGMYLEVTNEVSKVFTIPIGRVSYLVEGDYDFDSFLVLHNMVLNLKPTYAENVYNILVEKKEESSAEAGGGSGSSSTKTVAYTLEYISNVLYPPTDESGGVASGVHKHVIASVAQKLYAAYRLLASYGNVFFDLKGTDELTEGAVVHGLGINAITAAAANNNVVNVYIPLERERVISNMKEHAALREFKARYKKLAELSAATSAKDGKSHHSGGGKGGKNSLASAGMIVPEIPERVSQVLLSYAEGLKQIVIERHPWVANGWARHDLNETSAERGRQLLDMLGLAPSAKNARKVLEVGGIWKPTVNVEKYVMQIRDEFPPHVMAEAVHLVENADSMVDMDERIRRDLRHLGAYAIDREGAAEVDDAVSIEFLEDGREKLWIHIADVSHWVRPGSQLSLEAERRMTSVYMPDERISMFPEVLTTELLSLGARLDSYALSCGVVLNAEGDVESYEVCPSRVRVTRRLSYAALDEILAEAEVEGGGVDNNAPLVPSSTSNRNDDDNKAEMASTESSSVNKFSDINSDIRRDLVRLQHWALLRNQKRMSDGALDDMLRHKTELYLVVREREIQSSGGGAGGRGRASTSDSHSQRRDVGSSAQHVPPRTRAVVNGYMSWSNASSVSLVSEYMVLMCQVLGSMCRENDIPVWYKVQEPYPPIKPADLELRHDENLVLRSARLISHLRPANDSKVPGRHVTTGSAEYVQCTSPIRRYHDLYNHYRLKAAMHGASLGPSYDTEERTKEEAGITMLDQMATAEERLQTLIACRRVVRYREQFWLKSYMEKLCSTRPRLEFESMVFRPLGPYSDALWQQASFPTTFGGVGAAGDGKESGISGGDRREQNRVYKKKSLPEALTLSAPTALSSPDSSIGFVSEVLVMQLGSFKPCLLFHQRPLSKGKVLRCHFFKQFTNPVTYVLLASDEPFSEVPTFITDQLMSAKERNVASLLHNSIQKR